MARTKKPNLTPKRKVSIQIETAVHDQLSWLADDLGVSVGALLRWGAMLVFERFHEGKLPESLAHIKGHPLGADGREPNVIPVAFERSLIDLITHLAESRGLTTRQLVHDVVQRDVLQQAN